MTLAWIILSTFFVSIISLIGIVTLAVKEGLLKKIIFYLIGFSAGALIGGAFLHILPEAIENSSPIRVFYYTIAGIVIFFLMERYFHWRHCHEGHCSVHVFTYLNLIGDTVHNFFDGLIIAASFIVSFNMGLTTTLAIILHEIPQELGDFGVLIYGGFSRRKALFYNFLSALAAIVGALFGYSISWLAQGFTAFVMPLAAGGFIYIASSDLIPEIHKESDQRKATLAFVAFLCGIVFMGLFKQLLHS